MSPDIYEVDEVQSASNDGGPIQCLPHLPPGDPGVGIGVHLECGNVLAPFESGGSNPPGGSQTAILFETDEAIVDSIISQTRSAEPLIKLSFAGFVGGCESSCVTDGSLHVPTTSSDCSVAA